MSRRERIIKELIVEPGTEANIAGRDPGWTGGPEFEELSARRLGGTAGTGTPWAARAGAPRGCTPTAAPPAPGAPWYVTPAHPKPVMQAMVAAILVDTIGSLDLSWP